MGSATPAASPSRAKARGSCTTPTIRLSPALGPTLPARLGPPGVILGGAPRSERARRPAPRARRGRHGIPERGTGACRSGAGRTGSKRPRGSRSTSRTARPGSPHRWHMRETPAEPPRAVRSYPPLSLRSERPPCTLVSDTERPKEERAVEVLPRLDQARSRPVAVSVAISLREASVPEGTRPVPSHARSRPSHRRW